MELRRLSICIALFVLAYVSQCSEARHAMQRRQATEESYEDLLADEANDDEAQNDAEGNDPGDDDMVNAQFLTNATNYNSSVGGTLRLECAVSPDDGVVVSWKKNNSMYFLGSKKAQETELGQYNVDSRFTIAANSTDLQIRNVQPADSGVYKCEILQPDQPSIEHTLTVLESPRIIRFTASNNGQVIEGDDLVLTCEVVGSPPPKIVWSREGDAGNQRLHEQDGDFSMDSVHIKNVKKQHSGKYYCYAFNGIGNSQAEFKVTVMGKPRVQVHRHIINSAIDVDAVLQCSVHDQLASHIRWYKDGVRIEDSFRQYMVSTIGQHSNLTVTPTADADFGTFTCEAENDLGKHNKSIELVQSPVVEELIVDGPKLIWKVHSHQPLDKIEVQLRNLNGESDWQPFDVPLPLERRREYEIIYSLADKQLEAGKYEANVRVKNQNSWSANTDTAIVDIVLEEQPELIQHASIFRGADNEAPTVRPASVLLSTTLMYLLVRMM